MRVSSSHHEQNKSYSLFPQNTDRSVKQTFSTYFALNLYGCLGIPLSSYILSQSQSFFASSQQNRSLHWPTILVVFNFDCHGQHSMGSMFRMFSRILKIAMMKMMIMILKSCYVITKRKVVPLLVSKDVKQKEIQSVIEHLVCPLLEIYPFTFQTEIRG